MEPMNLNMSMLFLLIKEEMLGRRRGMRNSSRNIRDNKNVNHCTALKDEQELVEVVHSSTGIWLSVKGG